MLLLCVLIEVTVIVAGGKKRIVAGALGINT